MKDVKDVLKNYTDCREEKALLQGQVNELKEQNIRLEKVTELNIQMIDNNQTHKPIKYFHFSKDSQLL